MTLTVACLVGVTGIYIVAINDVFVTQAWKEKLNAKDSKLVHFLADDTGAVSSCFSCPAIRFQ